MDFEFPEAERLSVGEISSLDDWFMFVQELLTSRLADTAPDDDPPSLFLVENAPDLALFHVTPYLDDGPLKEFAFEVAVPAVIRMIGGQRTALIQTAWGVKMHLDDMDEAAREVARYQAWVAKREKKGLSTSLREFPWHVEIAMVLVGDFNGDMISASAELVRSPDEAPALAKGWDVVHHRWTDAKGLLIVPQMLALTGNFTPHEARLLIGKVKTDPVLRERFERHLEEIGVTEEDADAIVAGEHGKEREQWLVAEGMRVSRADELFMARMKELVKEYAEGLGVISWAASSED